MLPTRSSSRRNARLTALNNGPQSCVFAGYPGFYIHNGKAYDIQGEGKGRPKPVTLHKGARVSFDLRYTPDSAKHEGDLCVTGTEALAWAPHGDHNSPARVPVTDTHGRVTPITACGEAISMSPPHHTQG
ncbi:DUF4232 domain-containing protein [Streptomyces sp. MMS24-I31]|uniref:DUF4232 domain-containing protein n=1 Tax=Streptomyces sp. MMS24-I31 TaxID=3351563 RepID=UPI003896D12C